MTMITTTTVKNALQDNLKNNGSVVACWTKNYSIHDDGITDSETCLFEVVCTEEAAKTICQTGIYREHCHHDYDCCGNIYFDGLLVTGSRKVGFKVNNQPAVRLYIEARWIKNI